MDEYDWPVFDDMKPDAKHVPKRAKHREAYHA